MAKFVPLRKASDVCVGDVGITSRVTCEPGAVLSSWAASATVSWSSRVPSMAATMSFTASAPHLSIFTTRIV